MYFFISQIAFDQAGQGLLTSPRTLFFFILLNYETFLKFQHIAFRLNIFSKNRFGGQSSELFLFPVRPCNILNWIIFLIDLKVFENSSNLFFQKQKQDHQQQFS